MQEKVEIKDIFEAQKAIRPYVPKSPLFQSRKLSRQFGKNIFYKLETANEVGAFKIRGATNSMRQLDPAALGRGVVTISSGNHGKAVMWAANQFGARAIVIVSNLVPQNKIESMQEQNGEVRVFGDCFDDTRAEAMKLVTEEGMTFIDCFDDANVIRGQGTLGLELLEDLPAIDAVVVPLGGGGLISGIAMALKSVRPEIRVIGVSMERGPAMYHSIQAGKPIYVQEEKTVADSLGGGIGLDNQYTFNLVQKLVDDVILVSEEEIMDAMAWLFREERLIMEGAGAAGVAALLNKKLSGLGNHVVFPLTGNNVDTEFFREMLKTH